MLIYKTVEVNGTKYIVMSDKGMPIIYDDNDSEPKEIGVDAIFYHNRLPEVNAESKKRKERIRELEAELEPLKKISLDDGETIDDFVKKAEDALEQVKNFDAKALEASKDIENIKKEATQLLEVKLKKQEQAYAKEKETLQGEINTAKETIDKLMIADKFSSSKFVKERLNMTTEGAKRYFSQHFKVVKTDRGLEVHAFDNEGNQLLSQEKGLEPVTDFDEALEMLVDRDTDRDSLLVGNAGGGTGKDAGIHRPGDGVNPFMKGEHFNLTKQMELARENPQRAKRLAEAAGVKLNI